MEQAILHLLYEYINIGKEPDVELANNIGSIILQNASYYAKITKVVFENVKQLDGGLAPALYSDQFATISFDMNIFYQLYNSVIYEYGSNLNADEVYQLKYFLFLKTLLHEYEHVLQHDIIKINSLGDLIITSSQEGMENLMNEYEEDQFYRFVGSNWMINPIERLAEINAIKKTLAILESSFYYINIDKYFNKMYQASLNMGYDVSRCPTIDFLRNVKQNEAINEINKELKKNNYSPEMKLELGL